MKRPIISPRWEEIFASFGDGLVVLDTECRLIGINPAAEQITGFSGELVLGHSLWEAFPGNEEILERLKNPMEEGSALTLHEVPWKGWRRERATVDLSVTPSIGDTGDHNAWIVVFRDVTPLKNLQEEVRKSDRLAMMGTIAAGLAHEIKNPLGGIKGAAQLLARDKISDEFKECVEIIVREADRVNRLIGRLLALTRPKDLKMEPININELLDSILRLEEVSAPSQSVRIVREFDPSLPPVMGDDDELRQAFLNFVKNALEAVEEGKGKIRVKTRLMTEFKIKNAAGRKSGRLVLVEIQDNGAGMNPEDLSKIFTPFFTMKNTGSGLGMAISQQIVTEHGGNIRVTSEKGKGTTVQVSLRSGL